MLFKKRTLAIAISVALIGSLTACSGGSNQSSPVVATPPKPVITPTAPNPANGTTTDTTDTGAKPTTEKPSNNKPAGAEGDTEAPVSIDPSTTSSELERSKLETLLDPAGKIQWRQAVNFVPSSDTAVNDPLKESQNGKISPQVGAAAYFNGHAEYQDGAEVKDFRNADQRNSTNYDPSFMTKAPIDSNKLQRLDIQNKEGKTVASIAFVNQQYSSYNLFKSAQIPTIHGYPSDEVMTGYLAVPTKATTELKNKGQVTYRGHTLIQKRPNSTEMHLGDIELNADFDTMKISGKLTNRDDVLLDGSVKYESEILDKYTSDKDDLEEGMELKTEAEIEAMFEKEYAAHRKVDVTINPIDIKTDNGVVSFNKSVKAYSYPHEKGKTITPGVAGIGGIFAGDKAQEVVGEIVGGERFGSFGATEVQKEGQQ